MSYNASDHPRAPKGTPQGGQFTQKAGVGVDDDLTQLPEPSNTADFDNPLYVRDIRRFVDRQLDPSAWKLETTSDQTYMEHSVYDDSTSVAYRISDRLLPREYDSVTGRFHTHIVADNACQVKQHQWAQLADSLADTSASPELLEAMRAYSTIPRNYQEEQVAAMQAIIDQLARGPISVALSVDADTRYGIGTHRTLHWRLRGSRGEIVSISKK